MAKQYRLLVVDDEELSLKLLASDLEDQGYEVVKAEDGAVACNILKNDSNFDVILLDRMMPNMNGMEVVAFVKNDSNLKNIPIIMQTAAASTQQVQEGIDSGVYYYLTKPFEPKILFAIVKSAIRDNLQKQFYVEESQNIFSSLKLMEDSYFSFSTLEDVKNLSYLIANCCPDSKKVIIGITEMMMNAVEHGNLQISFEEKTQMLYAETWLDEIKDRLKHKEYMDKKAHLFFHKEPELISITIEDEGLGFDWEPFMDFSLNRATLPNGRGVATARGMSFDSIEYIGKGNKVICNIKTPKA